MNHPQAPLFEQFLRERTFLKNVTPRTIVWYRVAFKSYGTAFPLEALPSRASLQQLVIGLRERNIKPVTCNTYIGAMNAYCRWLHEEGHAKAPVRLQKLRVEKCVLELLDERQMRALIAFRPKTYRETRLHAAVLLVMDTGLCVSEALRPVAQGARRPWVAAEQRPMIEPVATEPIVANAAARRNW